MNSKVKTIIGLLLFAVLIGGAYAAYNFLSNRNLPDSGFPGSGISNSGNGDITVTPGTEGNTAEGYSPEKNTADIGEKDENSGEGTKDTEGEENKGTADAAGEKSQELVAFDFTVYDTDGNAVKLSDFFGKPVIINFWATWCPYCIEEMPVFEEKYKTYGDDIHFLMIDSVDGQRETIEKGEKFINEKGYTFPVYFDSDFEASYAYQAYSLPTTVFIDKDGYIVAYHPGMLTESLLQKGIDLILE